MPWHAWGMVGWLFSDVVYGYEPNPFYFSHMRYITLEEDAEGSVTCGQCPTSLSWSRARC
jgi:hypothetical protein